MCRVLEVGRLADNRLVDLLSRAFIATGRGILGLFRVDW